MKGMNKQDLIAIGLITWAVVITLGTLFMAVFCFKTAQEYASLSDSYDVEVTENGRLQRQVTRLETEIAELESQLPK